MASSKLPTVNFIIPTLNAALVLTDCLKSIKLLDYPASQISITLADAGSTDATLSIAKKYGCTILPNPLKTGEAGKAVGITAAVSDFIVLLDSDNIIPHPQWLNQLLKPLLSNTRVIGSESWAFTYRSHSGFIERYSALLGANDPYAWFCGIYDRYSLLTGRFTNINLLDLSETDTYLLFSIKSRPLPTIGANGTLYRTSFIKNQFQGEYFFDTDFLQSFSPSTSFYFAKIKNSIIHTYCESSILKFSKKQNRRVIDFYSYAPLRSHSWSSLNSRKAILFLAYSYSFFLPLFHSLKGYLIKKDLAWFFHPLACLITASVYLKGYLFNLLGLHRPLSRHAWKQ